MATAGALIGLRLKEWSDKRPDKLAERESTQSQQAITRQAYKSVGVTTFRWVTFGSDTCPICEELDGKVVGVDVAFVTAGDEVEGDETQQPIQRGSNTFHPPLHDGCVCQVVAD